MKQQIGLVILGLCISLNVYSKIPNEYFRYGVGNCYRQLINNGSSWNLSIMDAVSCDSLYADDLILQVAIDNIDYHKEIYIYDHFNFSSVRVFILKNQRFDFYDLYGGPTGAALYQGQNEKGQDVFLIRLVNSFRPKTSQISLYVKMSGRQYQIENIRFTPGQNLLQR